MSCWVGVFFFKLVVGVVGLLVREGEMDLGNELNFFSRQSEID